MAIVSNQVKDIVQQEMLTEIRTFMNEARSHLARQVNQPLLAAYWNIGRVIVEHEQNQNVRAEYGKEVLKQISRPLTKAFGKVFSRFSLQNMRLLYLAYPKCQTMSGKLSWSHYCELLVISDEKRRGVYEKECARSNCSVRELKNTNH